MVDDNRQKNRTAAVRSWGGRISGYAEALERQLSIWIRAGSHADLLNVSGNKTLCIRFFQYIFSTPDISGLRPHSCPQESVLIRGKNYTVAAHRQADPFPCTALSVILAAKFDYHGGLHFRRFAIHLEGLIFPFLHRVQRGLYQEGMSAFGFMAATWPCLSINTYRTALP